MYLYVDLPLKFSKRQRFCPIKQPQEVVQKHHNQGGTAEIFPSSLKDGGFFILMVV